MNEVLPDEKAFLLKKEPIVSHLFKSMVAKRATLIRMRESQVEHVMQGGFLEESLFKDLCSEVRELLLLEENVVSVTAPVTVVGDIHGQFHDLTLIFEEVGGKPSDTNKYVFLGDYVDRGMFSVETLTLLLLYKVMWPACVTLLRGNHESRSVSEVYGFYDECHQRYGNANCFKYAQAVFDLLPLSCLIDQRIFCVHGGLSPIAPRLDDVRRIGRGIEIPAEGAMTDLLWNDPERSVALWRLSERGRGWLFGSAVVDEFHHLNGTWLIARSHQLVKEGVDFPFIEEGKPVGLATIWSAPNYCYRCGNSATVMLVDEGVRDFPAFPRFEARLTNDRPNPQAVVLPYFL